MATAVVRHAAARLVVVSEPNPYRRALAERMGATIAIDPRQRDLHDVQHELGMVEGFDVVLEISGNPVAFRTAIDNIAHGASLAILSIPTRRPVRQGAHGLDRVTHKDDAAAPIRWRASAGRFEGTQVADALSPFRNHVFGLSLASSHNPSGDLAHIERRSWVYHQSGMNA